MSCSRTDDERIRYVAGLMGEDEAFRFERHVLTCPECRHAIEVLGAEERLLRAVMAEIGKRGDVVSSVMRRIMVRRVRLWRWVAAGVAAAALLIAAFLPWSQARRLHVATHTVMHNLTLPPPKPRPLKSLIIDPKLPSIAEEEGID